MRPALLEPKQLVSRNLHLLVFAAGALLLIAGGFVAARALGYRVVRGNAASSNADPDVVQGEPGAWGQLEHRELRIDPPDEFVFVPQADQPPVSCWCFHGSTKEQALEFLKSSGVSTSQLAQIEKTSWKTNGPSACVEPGDDFILALDPAVRAKVYSYLVEFEENSRQIDPVWFEAGQVDGRLKDSGLMPSSIDLLKSLLYPQGPSLLLFADFEPALRHLPNNQERHRFMKAVSRKQTLIAGLHIRPDS